MRRNRILYGGLTISVLLAAIMYGDPFMFMTLYALVAMPIVSLFFAVITLYGMGLNQQTEGTKVVKGEINRYIITLTNRSKIGFGTMRCMFFGDNFAVETAAAKLRLDVRPFMKPVRFPMEFTIKYRGMYLLGLERLEILDFLGLFRLQRKLPTQFEVVAYPRVTDLEHMHLALHMLSKAPANLVINQEDYADYTDVRPYGPSDPIKKVHWKLTAKRGEWIVKNYQSSALNSMVVLLDAQKCGLNFEETVKLEDAMVEYTVAVVRHCLQQQMPVELLFGRDTKEKGRHIGDFDGMYALMAMLSFSDTDFTVNESLDDYLLKEVSQSVNMIVLTSKLDMPLYERILNAVRFGHYIAIIYFEAGSKESDAIFERLQSSGLQCLKVGGVRVL